MTWNFSNSSITFQQQSLPLLNTNLLFKSSVQIDSFLENKISLNPGWALHIHSFYQVILQFLIQQCRKSAIFTWKLYILNLYFQIKMNINMGLVSDYPKWDTTTSNIIWVGSEPRTLQIKWSLIIAKILLLYIKSLYSWMSITYIYTHCFQVMPK